MRNLKYKIEEVENSLVVFGNTGIKVYLGQIEIYLSGMNSICFDSDGIVHGAVFKLKELL